jgi:hypothetical protein
MKLGISLIIFSLIINIFLFAEIPAGYYDSASDLTGTDLKNALHDIIDNNTNTNYDASSTGARGQMYAYFDNHSNTITCVYTGFEVSHTYGTFTAPSGINCEHTFCQSWFQGIPEQAIAKADVHHLFPVEGGVNSSRSNYPMDDVNTINHTYHDAGDYYSYLGTNTEGATVFEPDDAHKGDAARAMLYFSVRYQMDLTQGGVDMLATLITWHEDDRVSTEEENRNDGIYDYQGNRNPFVDEPDYVGDIWGATPADLTPPIIQNIFVESSTLLYVHFSESVDETTSETTSNYSIDNGIGNPTNAVRGVSSNNSIVSLTVSSLSRGVTYNLTVNNIKDLHDNTIEAGSQRKFQVLETGDILVLGVNTSDPDDFTFLTTVDILNGTQITFTDNGWFSAGGFRANEGWMKYIFPEDMPAGTITNYIENDDSGDFFDKTGGFLLAEAGDQLLIFQGDSSSPLFVYGLNIEGNAVWQADATSPNTSALPSGLTNGTTACAVQEYDNVKYNGSTNFSSQVECLSTVSNASNWTGSATRYDLTTFSDFTLPVELSSFTAQYLDNTPTIYWQTQSETDNMGWLVYRNDENDFSSANTVSEFIHGYGTTTQTQAYIFKDTDEVVALETYYYWLESIDYSGTVHHYERVAQLYIPEISDPNQNITPPVLYEVQAYPNPFSESTKISFLMKEAGFVSVSIFNLKGELVKELPSKFVNADDHASFICNGKDKNGKYLANGLYLYSLNINDKLYTTKQIVLFK